MQNVLLCGCGNIGFRHLQALSAMAVPAMITIVEPQAALHPRIAEHIAGAAGGIHRFALLGALPHDPAHFALAIIATSAPSRKTAFDSITSTHKVDVMLLEKLLFQTLGELEAVGRAIEAQGIKAFVNCGRRYFPGYHALKAAAAVAGPLDVTVSGSQFGMASNTVHFLDLAEFLNDSELVSLDISGLIPGSIPSKRGGFVEVYGRVTGRLANGASIEINCRDEPAVAVNVAVAGKEFTARIDETARTIAMNDTAPEPFSARNVSEMPEIYADALTMRRIGLAPYADSARQHRLFLNGMRQHLGLSNDRDDICPIS